MVLEKMDRDYYNIKSARYFKNISVFYNSYRKLTKNFQFNGDFIFSQIYNQPNKIMEKIYERKNKEKKKAY